MYYTYRQTHSGGRVTRNATLADYVIIEAESAEQADCRLLALGGYFDGVEAGIDCPCCGDRWQRAARSPWPPTAEPTIAGALLEHATTMFPEHSGWRLYRLDGSIERGRLRYCEEAAADE
jgi:hypothetical protein